MSLISQNLQAIHQRIERAVTAAGRAPGSVQLLAVSKTFDAAAVADAVAQGQTAFGENYVQETLDKIATLAASGAPALEWHFIGPLQSNKTRQIAEHVDWVHSVERLKIAQRLSDQRPPQLPPLNICLQVNISGEASKSGTTVQDMPALAAAVAALPRLRLRGLMAIPAPGADVQQQRAAFAQVRVLFENLRAQGLALDTLSMGMSDDLEAAIAEGATIVRIGSAIFGARTYPSPTKEST
ncbi:YggS family pyridoxal phosphate-dependent enzyme [Herbaspirillum sp. RTI4]|uniref:YggS family pyridoxal phosphate-dependent enzyme n=1 Tax=Herbaspirillum sp. RTI4 TaxID=3048640 RepID=UPI002AB53BBE|nr:YggS family pyridoxal phosphate-dependent enzyme [Herbaspirillum sp. RTI4]MDY7577978.1 YggS family pyridoxal phosphate-dependent enzyme [Herbaspirillum sp. RTI4]MEA9983443.1 YggS family pyridoxal phosphate-dependent enzyme [Herbaspirillum sp. RTI4]